MNERPTIEQIREMREPGTYDAMQPTQQWPTASAEPAMATPAEQPRVDGAPAATRDTAGSSVPPAAAVAPAPGGAETDGRILDRGDAEQLRARWSQVQGMFVDEPRTAVQQADALVAQVIDRVERTFAEEKGALEREWNAGESVETEALRLAMRRYRAFFDRLLAL